MAREQGLVPIIGTAHTDTETSPHFKLTPKGRAAIDDLDDQLEDCADESSEGAREFAVLANHDTVGKQARIITEQHAKLDEQTIIIRELVASQRMSLTAIQGLTTERDGALKQSAELLAKNLTLVERLLDCRAWLPNPAELRPGARQQLEQLLARLNEVIPS